ncbi:cytochrome P450 [Phenylobacterium sp.]|uniref:cytochrome P450 n=1 Tax=Phenylobacterium sp. TaxID=1871053 RepID=UPI0025D2F4F7|nr:cytochrome P450 [Phenylobacterium sp.]
MDGSTPQAGGPAREDPWRLPLEGLDPSRAELFQTGDQHEVFRRLRLEDPVHYTPDSPFGPFWSITRFHDIVAVDCDHQTFSSNRDIVIGDNPEGFAPPMFIAMDPPRHDVQRKVASPAVAPARLQDLEMLIRQRVGKILDALPRNETFNWVDHVSIELTTQMLATLFDFPWEDRHLLPYWSDVTTTSETVGVVADMANREKVLHECLAYFTGLWRARAAQPPKFDFISLLAHSPDTKDMIDDPMEFLGNLMLLIVGGNDTTRNSITGGVLALNQFPDQYAKLKADPSLIPNMVPEIIRWQTPLAHMRRTCVKDVEFQGKLIRQGERVIMWYVSGNRDETVIEAPEQFIIDRDRSRHHLSFGFGIHRCMGNRVAELQLKILWEEILARFEHVEVVGEPVRLASNFVQGYTHLPVRIRG